MNTQTEKRADQLVAVAAEYVHFDLRAPQHCLTALLSALLLRQLLARRLERDALLVSTSPYCGTVNPFIAVFVITDRHRACAALAEELVKVPSLAALKWTVGMLWMEESDNNKPFWREIAPAPAPHKLNDLVDIDNLGKDENLRLILQALGISPDPLQ